MNALRTLALLTVVGCANLKEEGTGFLSDTGDGAFPPATRTLTNHRRCPGTAYPDVIEIPDNVLSWSFDVCPFAYSVYEDCYAPELSSTAGDELVLDGDELLFTNLYEVEGSEDLGCVGGDYFYSFTVTSE